MGEFIGDDAGSPAFARLHIHTTRLQQYQPDNQPAEPLRYDIPLETTVERRPVPFRRERKPIALDLRLLMGRHWLKLLADAIGNYAQDFIDAYPIDDPDPTDREDAESVAHPEAWSMIRAVAGRRMDGVKLYLHLKADSANRAYDDVPAVLDPDKPNLDALAQRFVAWFERLISQPAVVEANAWIPDRLEYQFRTSAPFNNGEKVFTAEEYYHGHLDWYNLDIDSTSNGLGAALPPEMTDPQATETQTFLPTQVMFDGMPHTRWWKFEDSRTNFGFVKPDTTDLAKLLFIEFGLVYANDWYLLPYEVDAGTIVQVRGLAVTNVFEERIWVEAAGRGEDDAWQRWSMFTINTQGDQDEPADTSLLILPTTPKIQESRPLEEVLLLRDEMANMVWGVERTIALPTGWRKSGPEAGHELYNFYLARLLEELETAPPAAAPDPAAAIRYRVMNSVPENWIPFIPVHIPGDNREVQLQRAAMPRILKGDPDDPLPVRPRTALLRQGLDPKPTPADPNPPRASYFLHEEEVPRSGVLVQHRYRRTRWNGGRVFTWLGVIKHNGFGGGSSGLAFDQIVPTRANGDE
jgi:hypothetical protein